MATAPKPRSPYTLVVDQRATEFLDAERSPVSALIFCTPYAVATTLLTGDLVGADFAAPAVAEEDRWRLAAKTRLEHDGGMTRESLISEAPFGEALRQAGPRAAKWLEEVGTQWLVELVGELPPPCESIETATRATSARVEVRLTNGEVHTRELTIPVGAIGPDARASHAELVRAKFLGVGGPDDVADIAATLPTATPKDVRAMLELSLEPHPGATEPVGGSEGSRRARPAGSLR